LIALEEHFAIADTLDDSEQYAATAGASTITEWSELRAKLLDLDAGRLAEMDAHGIERAILSLNSPGIQGIPDRATAIDVARRANDVLADAIAKHPTRFGGFAALPMQDPDAAAAELTRCMRDLGFKGALVNGFSQRGTRDTVVYYDDPRYASFWTVAEQLRAPFYLHPRDPLPSREPVFDGHPWLLGPVWAFAMETAIHALRLMASGLFDRHPRLTIILGHLGEGLPYNIWRVDHRLRKSPRGIPARRPLGDYLREHFYLTTSGNFRTPTLMDAIAEVGVGRILFSVDYPFERTVDAVTWFEDIALPHADRRAIAAENSALLFDFAARSQAQSGIETR
jgi:gamma-resorcylate decarboxylase